MKKERIVIVIGMLILVSFLPITKANVQINQYTEHNNFTSYEYPSENELIITFHLSELIQQQVTTEKGDFTQLQISDSGFVGAIGSPQLPAVTRLYATPTLHVSFEILESHLKETRHIDRIYPMQSPQADCDCAEKSVFTYNESAYQKDVTSPDHLVEISNSGKIRDIPFVKLKFFPVQYNPYRQTALIYDSIKVKLMFTLEGPVCVEPNYTQKQFYRFYQNVFNNWPGFIANTVFQQQIGIKDAGCDYLIITHQDFYSQAQELAEWKHHTGFLVKTVNVSDIGTTYTQIRQYIQNAYDTWTPRPSYILLLGDADFVPTTYVNGVATDLWYATVNGTDYYPDIFIGRIPADTPAQADVMIQKTITYEQTPPTLPSFYNNFAVAAYFQDDDTNGYEDRRFVLTSEEVRDYLLSLGYNGERIYCTDSYVNPTHYNNDYYSNGQPLPSELLRPTFAWDGNADDIINAIQQGVFLLNHRDHGDVSGWGDPYFTISHINSLSNGELLPVVFSLNCLTGQFDTGECFCEAFLKKPNGGAVAIFGATEVSYSGYNDYLCRGLYDAMWPNFDTEVGDDIALHHLGEILNYGKVFMTETWGDPWGEEEYTFELFHCFGDPSLDMYTALPANLEVTYTLLSDTVQVTVKGNGDPLQGACVCISQENGFFKSGMTNANGIVELDITEASVEKTVSLVATAHNYLYHNMSFLLNQKPQKPDRPSGQNEGKPNTEYMYTTSTIDADGDSIFYNFSWGDGTYSGWVGPFDSGAEGFARHSWDKKGTFNITVKAKDSKGDESEWSEPLAVVMPYKITFPHPLLQWMYQQFINRFPLLATLLKTMV
jgi:Peptidase family C25/Propeptide_C25